MVFAPVVGCPRRCASRISRTRFAFVVISASTVLPAASPPSPFGSSSVCALTSNDMSPTWSNDPASPKLRPRQDCPDDERRSRICWMATSTLALTETADATRPSGVETSEVPPAWAACLRLQANGAAEKVSSTPVRGRICSGRSLARTFTARAKSRACRLQSPTSCGAASDTVLRPVAMTNTATRIVPQAERATAWSLSCSARYDHRHRPAIRESARRRPGRPEVPGRVEVVVRPVVRPHPPIGARRPRVRAGHGLVCPNGIKPSYSAARAHPITWSAGGAAIETGELMDSRSTCSPVR